MKTWRSASREAAVDPEPSVAWKRARPIALAPPAKLSSPTRWHVAYHPRRHAVRCTCSADHKARALARPGDPRNRVSALDLLSLLETARGAAHRAGIAILEVYNAVDAPDVRRKADESPVTRADERAEVIIVEILRAKAPEIPVIAEETAEREGLPGSPPPRFWLVDPLDGTKEFLRRNGEFTVNIALIEGDRPMLGVVHVPALAETFAAAGPGTATRQRGDAPPEPIAARPVPRRGAVVVHSRSHENNEKLTAYLDTLEAPVTRVSGSAIKFGLIAAGEADLYPRFGPTMEWDTAAGQAVLEAAGGHVLGLSGEPLQYGKPGLKNDGFLAWGRRG